MSEPTPKPSMQTLVRHGLEILTQGIGQRLRVNPEHTKAVARSAIERFVQENVKDEPLSLEGFLEDVGVLRRKPRRRLK
jgi:hypothetical protein